MVSWIAGQLVSPFFSSFAGKVDKILEEEYFLRKGEKKAISSLYDLLTPMKDIIARAESQEFPDDAIRWWLDKLKDILYPADDVLDEYATMAAIRSRMEYRRRKRKLQLLVSPLMFWQKRFFRNGRIVHQIQRIRQEFEDLVKSAQGITALETRFTRGVNTTANFRTSGYPSRETSSVLGDASSVLGRDEVRAEAMRWLEEGGAEDAAASALSVLSIVGMGGIGKTTLAKLIYNDQRVKDLFAPRIWVYVSQNFQLDKVTRDMLQLLEPSNMLRKMPETLEGLQTRVGEYLQGKRFILVLDDVWDDNFEKWKGLLEFLKQHVGKGSKVLVTSRMTNIVEQIKGIVNVHRPPIELKGLPDHHIRKIFNLGAFQNPDGPAGPVNEDDARQFEDIRDELIRVRLKGSPLAATTLGHALRNKLDLQHWKKIKHSRIWEIPQQGTNDLFPALYLSYLHLPSELKQCFAYFSLFPEGHKFNPSELYMLWISSGFIPTQSHKFFEDCGKEPLYSLSTQWSLFELYNSNSYMYQLWINSTFKSRLRGTIDVYRNDLKFVKEQFVVHDFLIELVEHVWKEECIKFIGDQEHSTSSKGHDDQDCTTGLSEPNSRKLRRIRHLSVLHHLSKPDKLQHYLKECQNLRTLFFKGKDWRPRMQVDRLVCHNLCNSRCLRVLVLHSCDIYKLPESIGRLIHLRYLSLKDSIVEKNLPKSLGKLCNLQFLDLQCYINHALVCSFSKLVDLKYLAMFTDEDVRVIGMDQLTSLQVLHMWFNIKTKRGRYGQEIGQLKNLNLLRYLAVRGIQNIESGEEASRANLHLKQCLESLVLSWEGFSMTKPHRDDVIQNLYPPKCLKNLFVYEYEGTVPTWLVEKNVLPNLEHLDIIGCLLWRSLPLGHLSRLKVLRIKRAHVKYLSDLFAINGNDEIFPSLKMLHLEYMYELEGVGGDRFICLPKLEELVIADCQKLEILTLCVPNTAQVFSNTKPLTFGCEHNEKCILVCSSSNGKLKGGYECNDMGELEGTKDCKCILLPELKKLSVERMMLRAAHLPDNTRDGLCEHAAKLLRSAGNTGK